MALCRLVLPRLLALALLAACGGPAAAPTPTPAPQAVCPAAAEAYRVVMAPVLERWEKTLAQAYLAGVDLVGNPQANAYRATLAQIRQDTAAVAPDACLAAAHAALLGSMDTTLLALAAAQDGRPAGEVDRQLTQADAEMARFQAALKQAIGP